MIPEVARLFPVRGSQTCAAVLLAGVAFAYAETPHPAESGRLIVFVQPERSPVARSFTEDILPMIRETAGQLGATVTIVDATRGAPAEVTITPLLVYQNHRGRSVYQGRYTTIDRLRNFIRTSRYVPQGGAPLVRKRDAVRRIGRARIAAPIKVSPLTGEPPSKHDQQEFVDAALRSIAAGLSQFRMANEVTLRRSDRLFYMDFYPWRSTDGKLYLSYALFSQFHCKRPVFTSRSQPLIGPWDERASLFREATRALERAIADQTVDSSSGDGFDPIAESVPVVTWDSLGLSLPESPPNTTRASSAINLARRWIVTDSEPGDAPQIMFHFPPPADHFAGEIKRATGRLTLAADLSLTGAQGEFEADVSSLTMGAPDLDDALQGATYLFTQRFPTSRFVIAGIESEGRPVRYGELTNATMRGEFTMKGVSIPLTVRAEFEPIVAAGGAPRLLLRAAFQIDIKDFSLVGPNGPVDVKDTLLFDVNLTLKPDTDR